LSSAGNSGGAEKNAMKKSAQVSIDFISETSESDK
jgi:hypothetical protein